MALLQKDQMIQELKTAIRQASYVADRLEISRQNDFNICNDADRKVAELKKELSMAKGRLESVSAARDQHYEATLRLEEEIRGLRSTIARMNAQASAFGGKEREEIDRLRGEYATSRKVLSARILELEERIARMMLGETFRDDQQLFNKAMDRASEELRKKDVQFPKTEAAFKDKKIDTSLGEAVIDQLLKTEETEKASSVPGETYTSAPASGGAMPAPNKPTEETLESMFKDALTGITIRMDGVWDTELCCKQCKAEGISLQRLSFSTTSGLNCQYHGKLK